RRARSPHPSRLPFRASAHTGSGLPRRRGPTRGGETHGGLESRSRISRRRPRGGSAGDKPALMQDAHADSPSYEFFGRTKVVDQGTIQIRGELRHLFRAHLLVRLSLRAHHWLPRVAVRPRFWRPARFYSFRPTSNRSPRPAPPKPSCVTST